MVDPSARNPTNRRTFVKTAAVAGDRVDCPGPAHGEEAQRDRNARPPSSTTTFPSNTTFTILGRIAGTTNATAGTACPIDQTFNMTGDVAPLGASTVSLLLCLSVVTLGVPTSRIPSRQPARPRKSRSLRPAGQGRVDDAEFARLKAASHRHYRKT